VRRADAQDDGSVQVDEGQVNSMLAERLQAKMGRDFQTADRIRDQLRAMGVEVYDKEKTWKAGGGGGGGGGGGFRGGGGQFGPKGHDYRRDDDGSATVDEGKIDAMLAERLQAKMSRDFPTADRIRDQLRGMGIEVYDQERTWKAGGGGGGGGYGGGGGGYRGGGGGGGGGYRGGGGGGGGGRGGLPRQPEFDGPRKPSKGSFADFARGQRSSSSRCRQIARLVQPPAPFPCLPIRLPNYGLGTVCAAGVVAHSAAAPLRLRSGSRSRSRSRSPPRRSGGGGRGRDDEPRRGRSRSPPRRRSRSPPRR
jgi:hypothetical protein